MKPHNWEPQWYDNVMCLDCGALDGIHKDPLDSEGKASEVLRIQRRTDCDILIAKKAVKRLLGKPKPPENVVRK